MEFTGRLTHFMGVKQVGANGTNVMEFTLEELNPHNPDYPSVLLCTVIGSKVDEIKPYIKKDVVLKASYDPTAREWQGRWFGSNKVWKVEVAGDENTTAEPTSGNQGEQQTVTAPTVPTDAPAVDFTPTEGESDLPF